MGTFLRTLTAALALTTFTAASAAGIAGSPSEPAGAVSIAAPTVASAHALDTSDLSYAARPGALSGVLDGNVRYRLIQAEATLTNQGAPYPYP